MKHLNFLYYLAKKTKKGWWWCNYDDYNTSDIHSAVPLLSGNGKATAVITGRAILGSTALNKKR